MISRRRKDLLERRLHNLVNRGAENENPLL